MARLPFAANVEGNNEGLEDFTPLESGDYISVVSKSEYKQTKAKNGHYLQLIWKVIDGDKKGRTLFDNLNLDNPNPIAVEIANKALNSICQACGKVGVMDSTELHNIPVTLRVVKKPGDETNPASNDIKGYLPAAAVGMDTIEGGAGGPSIPDQANPLEMMQQTAQEPAPEAESAETAQTQAVAAAQTQTAPAEDQSAAGADKLPWE